MTANDATAEFEEYLAERSESLSALTPEKGFETFVNFYETVRAADCDLESDGDMLLAQWGTYDWGQGEHFEFDVTRQFILNGGEDDDIFQLSLTFRFPPTEALRGLGSGNKWCHSPGDVASFQEFVRRTPAYKTVASRSDVRPELTFGNAG